MQFLSQHGPLLLIWVAALAFLFWMTWRPQRKRMAEQQKLMESLQRGDRIVSAGGIYGTIVGLQDKTVTLEIDKGVQVRLDRRAVRRRLGDKEEE